MTLFRIHSLNPTAGGADVARRPEPSGLPAPAAASTSAVQPYVGAVQDLKPAPQPSPTLAHLNALLEERGRQLTAATRLASHATQQLQRLAEELCPSALDEERRKSSPSLDEWPAEKLVRFILDHTKPRLLKADRAAQQVESLIRAYSEILAENRQLLERLEPKPRQGPGPASQGDQSLVGPETAAHPAVRTVPARETQAAQSAPAPVPPLSSAPAEAMLEDAAHNESTSIHVDPARLDDVIRVMSVTGLARSTRLGEKLSQLWGVHRRDRLIGNTFDALTQAGLIRLHRVRAEWPQAPTQLFELTDSGAERARLLGARLVPSEIGEGLRRQLAVELISLVLQAAEVLTENGYSEVIAFPRPIHLPDGSEYVPALSARDRGANTIYVECERTKASLPREERWLRAAQVGGGTVHLITTSESVQTSLTSELNFLRVHHPLRILAFNIHGYQKGRRSADNSLWVYSR